MTALTIVALALGLSMDATAVSLVRGCTAVRLSPRDVLYNASVFGLAHVLMPLLGFGVGAALGPWMTAWDHWVAFGLLSAIGGKMVWEAYRPGGPEGVEAPERPVDVFGARTMFLLALATSIDALAVGVTLPLLGAPLLVSSLVIGAVAAALTALGLVVGRRFGAAFGRRLDVLGGLVLFAIGLRTLLEHLAAE